MSGGDGGGGGGGSVTVAIGCLDGRCRALCVIGIMGWFSGGSDAPDGTGAKLTDSLFVLLFKPTFISSDLHHSLTV